MGLKQKVLNECRAWLLSLLFAGLVCHRLLPSLWLPAQGVHYYHVSVYGGDLCYTNYWTTNLPSVIRDLPWYYSLTNFEK
jgi:hypothetical protein